MWCEQGEWQNSSNVLNKERERDGWANLALGHFRIQFSFPLYLVSSQSFNLSLPPCASVSVNWSAQLHLSRRDWLLLKLLYFNNCDDRFTTTDTLTLVLFSRSVCTSFWDPPHSQYSLSRRESRYIIMIERVLAQTAMTAFTQTHKYTKREKVLPFYFETFLFSWCSVSTSRRMLENCSSIGKATINVQIWLQ